MDELPQTNTLVGAIDWHSFGQLILGPYGWSFPSRESASTSLSSSPAPPPPPPFSLRAHVCVCACVCACECSCP